MGIDNTGNPEQHDDQSADPADSGDTNAERPDGRQASPDDDRGYRRAESLTREEYADTMRVDGPLTRENSRDVGPDGPDETGPAADRDVAGSADGDREDAHKAMLKDEGDRAGSTMAEPRSREEYADAMIGNDSPGGDRARSADSDTSQAQDAGDSATTVTHFHGEFKGQQLDLYTDGNRWAAAEAPRAQDTVDEKGDIPVQLPTGEELVDTAGEDSSRLERFRHKLYDQSDDALDIVEKNTNIAHDVFSHPPTSSYEATPTPEAHIYEAQHSVADPGSVATSLFTLGLVIDRAVHWAVGYYDKHAKGR